MSGFITRNVVLEKQDVRIVSERARKMGLGPKGFSAALRTIIRESEEMPVRKDEEEKGGEQDTKKA